MKIRVASKEDSAGIAKVNVESFRSANKRIVPDETLDALDYDKKKKQWARILDIDGVEVFVAEADGRIIGYASAGALDQKIHPGKGTLTSIYCLETYQGRGIGRALLKAAFESLHAQNIRKVVVEVFEENKTRGFYEKYGARFSHNTEIKMGGKSLIESVYEWPSVEDALKKL